MEIEYGYPHATRQYQCLRRIRSAAAVAAGDWKLGELAPSPAAHSLINIDSVECALWLCERPLHSNTRIHSFKHITSILL